MMVDVSRLDIFGFGISAHGSVVKWLLTAAAALSACAGDYCGAKLFRKETISSGQSSNSKSHPQHFGLASGKSHPG